MRLTRGADLRRRARIGAGVKEHPGGRGHLGEPARRGYRYARAGIAPGPLSRNRRERCRRPIEHCDWYGPENVEPVLPMWDLGEVIATHQPDETQPWEAPLQRRQRIRGVGRAEMGFDVADLDPAVGRGK